MRADSERPSVPLTAIALLTAHLLSCDGEPVSFPSNPPPSRSPSPSLTEAVPIDRATLRRLAGPGARDCGVATSRQSASDVYRCASEAFARRQPFFCHFGAALGAPLGPAEAASRGPTADGLVWARPTAFVGSGSSIAIAERRGDLKPVLTDLLRQQPLHVGSGMTLPRPAAGPVSLTSENDASGILIVQAIIGRDGRSRAASLLKPLPAETVNRAALDLVAAAPFEPARLFGVPVDVLTSVTLRADRGALRFERIPRAEPSRTIVIEGQEFPVAGTAMASPGRNDAERYGAFPTKVFDLGPDIRSPVAVSRGEPRFSRGEMKCRSMVVLRSVIDATGRVVAVADVSNNPDAFTRAYADALYAWTFRPATRNGVPVAVHFATVAHIKCG